MVGELIAGMAALASSIIGASASKSAAEEAAQAQYDATQAQIEEQKKQRFKTNAVAPTPMPTASMPSLPAISAVDSNPIRLEAIQRFKV